MPSDGGPGFDIAITFKKPTQRAARSRSSVQDRTGLDNRTRRICLNSGEQNSDESLR